MVADTDATARAAQDAGGQILTPAFDTPFGRMCAVADPQGASFFVMSAPAADA
jgi:predicted enzyme related to lactoylglutathione lyase